MNFITKYKKIFFTLACLLGVFVLVLWKFPNSKLDIKNISSSNFAKKLNSLKENAFNPLTYKELVNKPEEPKLEINSIIYWTNQNRSQNGNLPPLQESEKLNASAKIKLDDMFKNQYFEHESPDGKGPGDLAEEVHYEYLSIGENLALGYFKDSEDLINSWMASKGHRENILSTKYTEIGVAFGKGMYNGEETWLAVQEFGRPKNSCPSVDANIKLEINSLQSEINNLQPQLIQAKQETDAMNPQTEEEYKAYNQKVASYNSLVKIFNNKVDVLKSLTITYNSQVNKYNACLEN